MDSYFLHCCMRNMSDSALYLPLQPTSVIAECTVIALLPALVPRPIVHCMYVCMYVRKHRVQPRSTITGDQWELQVC